MPREAGKIQRGLSRGIRTTDDIHIVVAAGNRFRRTGSIIDAGAGQTIHAGHVQLAVLSAGRDDHRAAIDRVTTRELDCVVAIFARKADRFCGNDEACAERPRLQHRALRKLAAGDSGGEAEIVLDPRGGAGLAAESHGVHDLGVEPF